MIVRKSKLILAAIFFAGSGLLMAAAPAYAAMTPSRGSNVVAASFQSDACSGVTAVAGGTCGGKDTSGSTTLSNTVKTTIDILSAIVGIAAVIVIIISGLRFITSNGDASNVATARSGIIYAVVGLIIVALAQFIVHFVLGKIA